MSLYGDERFFDFDNSGDLNCFERGLMEHEEHVEMERILQITPSEVAAAAGSFQPDTVFFLHGTAVGRNGGGGEEEAYD